jgi:hypothetical protein
MKQQINEIKRMQQLAGLLNESYTNEVRSGDTVTFKKGRTHHLGKIDGKDYQIIPVNHIIGDRIKVTNWDDDNDFLIGIIKSIDGTDYEVEITNDKNLEEGVDEGISKALGTAALGAALAFGSPEKAAAQSPQGMEQTAFDSTFSISSMDDDKAGEALLISYQKNPFTADMWSKLSNDNKRLFSTLKGMINSFQAKPEDVQPEDIAALGRKYKNTPAAAEFLDREKAIKAAKTKTLEETINEGLPIGKSKPAQDAANALNSIVSKIEMPNLSQEARVAASKIIDLIDQDQAGNMKESIESTINEALNKDIKTFGQDLDKRFKEAGFDTLVLMQPATQEQLNIVKTKEKAVLFEVSQTPETQMLSLKVNPKMVSKAESIINKFQLSNYDGPVLKKGWTSKQVQGAINPGDIVSQKMDHSRGEWYFYRLAKVDTKVKNVQAESIEQVVNEALRRLRRSK